MKFKLEKSYGPAQVADITDFELRHNIQLPVAYKEFLLQENGGRPLDGYAEFDLPNEDESLVCDFYGINRVGTCDLDGVIDRLSGAMSCTDFLPIADDPGGNQICIGLQGKYCGKVYFWNHEIWDDKDIDTIFVEIFPSFEALLDTIK